MLRLEDESFDTLRIYQLMAGINPSQAAPIVQEDDDYLAPAQEEPAALTAEQLQLQAEEEEREFVKHQAALIIEEEEKEKIRAKNFDAHVRVILDGRGQLYDWLKYEIGRLAKLEEPIKRFKESHKKGLPTVKKQNGSESLFDIVLKNPNLTVLNKYNLLMSLFELGYDFKLLLSEPLVEYLLQDDGFNLFIGHMYSWSLDDGFTVPDLGVEQRIWKKLLTVNQEETVFNNLLRNSGASDGNKFLQYVTFWMSSFKSIAEVTKCCTLIARSIEKTKFAKYIPDINKMGKLLVCDEIIEHQDNDSQRAGVDVNEVLSQAQFNFLKTHRYSLFKGGFGATTSSNFCDLMTEDPSRAKEMHIKERKKFGEEFAIKLKKNS